MSIDLSLVAAQIQDMALRLKATGRERWERLNLALETMTASAKSLDTLKEKILGSKTTWLVAGLGEGLDSRYEAPPCPPEFTVLAADGSHIDVDRHSPVRCFLLNIGSVVFHYGRNPKATLISQPTLYCGEEDLVIEDPNSGGRKEPIEGALLAIKRTVAEVEVLAHLAESTALEAPALALLDGSLILWGLGGHGVEEFVRREFIDMGLLKALDGLKEISQRSRLSLASYISFPRSTEVVNALRLALCPRDFANCDHFCAGTGRKRECEAVAGVLDRDLFENLLSPGQRSASFFSLSSIVQKRYGPHEICFFYLRVDEEIARVEAPRWVAEDEGLLNLAHALILDQCHRGHGYPVALTEAHEKAAVTAADREQFWQLVHLALAEGHLPDVTSAKSLSKRTRWI